MKLLSIMVLLFGFAAIAGKIWNTWVIQSKWNIFYYFTADQNANVLSPVTNLLSDLLGGVLSLVLGLLPNVLGLVSTLLSSLSDSLNQASNSLVRNTVYLPQLNGILLNIENVYPQVFASYENASFRFEFVIYRKNLQREIAKLQSSSTPLTNAQTQQDGLDVQFLQQEYNQVISDYNVVFAPKCLSSPACSNTTIQLPDCSCFASAEVEQFLYDYNQKFLPFNAQQLAVFYKDVSADFNEDITPPSLSVEIDQITIDAQAAYDALYNSNGNADVSALLTKVSAEINTAVANFASANGNPDTDAFTGQPI